MSGETSPATSAPGSRPTAHAGVESIRRGVRTPRIVIVGGGFGGLSATRALARAPADVTLIDRRNHHLFQPLLYQVATAELSPGDIAYPIRSIFRHQKNATVLMAEVQSVDLAARRLGLADGSLTYDALILATGASHSYFGHDAWEPFAPGLKTLEDALEIRRRVLLAFERAERESDSERRRVLLTFVLVGGGPTGAELAGAISEISRHVLVSDFRSIDPRQARIFLIEAGPRILPAFPDDLAASAAKALTRLGVEIHVGAPVTRIEPEAVEFAGTRLAAGTIVWTAGVAASPLARSLGVPLDRAGRVLVEPDLSLPGHSEVFVIGDQAFLVDRGKPLPGVAQVAIQQGRHAARSALRALEGKPRTPFRYRDPGSLAVLGRGSAICDLGRIHLTGFVGWLVWVFVHILNLIGFRNRFVVMFEWAWAYFTWQRGARLITGPPRPEPLTAAPPRTS